MLPSAFVHCLVFAGLLVVTRCSVRVTIPTDVTNPALLGGASKRAADASATRILALVFLRGCWP